MNSRDMQVQVLLYIVCHSKYDTNKISTREFPVKNLHVKKFMLNL